MWKAERFEGTEQQDPLDQMVEFVNAHNLQPGHFQFAVATDEQGYEFCVMLYTEQKAATPPAEARPAGKPARGQFERGRFAPAGAPGERGRKPRGEFKPDFGPGRPGGRPGGGRGRGGAPGGRPGGSGGYSGGGPGKRSGPGPKRGR